MDVPRQAGPECKVNPERPSYSGERVELGKYATGFTRHRSIRNHLTGGNRPVASAFTGDASPSRHRIAIGRHHHGNGNGARSGIPM